MSGSGPISSVLAIRPCSSRPPEVNHEMALVAGTGADGAPGTGCDRYLRVRHRGAASALLSVEQRAALPQVSEPEHRRLRCAHCHGPAPGSLRSEEHTSELQSRANL